MEEKKIKEVRVSAKTDPKQLATSIRYSLKDKFTVRAYSLGEASLVLFKALALLNIIKDNDEIYDFQPILEYKMDKKGDIKNFLVCEVKKKE